MIYDKEIRVYNQKMIDEKIKLFEGSLANDLKEIFLEEVGRKEGSYLLESGIINEKEIKKDLEEMIENFKPAYIFDGKKLKEVSINFFFQLEGTITEFIKKHVQIQGEEVSEEEFFVIDLPYPESAFTCSKEYKFVFSDEDKRKEEKIKIIVMIEMFCVQEQ